MLPGPVLERLARLGCMPRTNLCHSLVQLRERSHLSKSSIPGSIVPHNRIMRELPSTMSTSSIVSLDHIQHTFFGGTIAVAAFGVIDICCVLDSLSPFIDRLSAYRSNLLANSRDSIARGPKESPTFIFTCFALRSASYKGSSKKLT